MLNKRGSASERRASERENKRREGKRKQNEGRMSAADRNKIKQSVNNIDSSRGKGRVNN